MPAKEERVNRKVKAVAKALLKMRIPKPRTNPQFEKYLEHIGHKVVVVSYGSGNDIWNVSIECETCNCVLTDEDRSC